MSARGVVWAGLHSQGLGRPAANGLSSGADPGGRTSSHQLFGVRRPELICHSPKRTVLCACLCVIGRCFCARMAAPCV